VTQAIETLQPSAADLRTDRPLPGQVVHKAALEQVFVTDWMHGPGEDWCTIAARLPLAHARFSDTAAPFHDVVLVAETARQAGLVVASEILDIARDRHFLLREVKVELDPIERSRKGRDTCDVLFSQDPSSKLRMRPGRAMAGAFLRTRLAIGGHDAGVSEVSGAIVPPDFYAGLRGRNREAVSGRGLPDPVPRADWETRTGRRNPANGVLTRIRPAAGERAYEASLIVEPDDPTFFDHPLDHVPGLLLLEGVRQVAVAGACEELGIDHSRLVVAGFEMRFSRIAEFHPDIVCAVTLDEGSGGGKVTCSQMGRPCCEGTVRIAHV
jgi:hypothetical protein